MSSKSSEKDEAATRGPNARVWVQHGDGAMVEEMRCERCKAIGIRGSSLGRDVCVSSSTAKKTKML